MSMLQESERDGGTFHYVLPGTRRGKEGAGMGGRQRRSQSEEAPQRPGTIPHLLDYVTATGRFARQGVG